MSEEKVTAIKAIKEYFPNVTMAEMKSLKKDERDTLGKLCAKELGKEYLES